MTYSAQKASLTLHTVSVGACLRFKLFVFGHFSVSSRYLVFGVGRVDSLAVSAGLQQDLDGVQLQQNLAGHAVEERDVGQGRRRQEENLTAGGALAQL